MADGPRLAVTQGTALGTTAWHCIAMQRANRPTPNRATPHPAFGVFVTQAEPCQLDEGSRCLARCLAVDTLAVHEQWPEVLEAFEELGASPLWLGVRLSK